MARFNSVSILFAWFILGLAGTPAYPWTETAPTFAVSKTVDIAVPSRTGPAVWRSGLICSNENTDCSKTSGSLNEVAVEIQGDFTSDVDGVFYVFRDTGSLEEVIPLRKVGKDGFWTASIEGEGLYLELVSKVKSPKFSVRQIVRSNAAGQGDIVMDNSPEFLLDSDAVRSANKASTARLIVGQQEFIPLANNLPSNVEDWCSGSLISEDLLLTVSHCVPLKSVNCRQTVALFGYAIDSQEPLIGRRCKQIVYFSPVLDIAILRLEKSSGQIESAELASRAPDEDEPLAVVQHPHGSIRLISGDAACKVIASAADIRPSREGIDFKLLTDLGFSHGCDTLSGSSGAPVFSADGKVIGVHQGAHPDRDENVAIRTDSVTFCIKIDATANDVSVLHPEVSVCVNEAD